MVSTEHTAKDIIPEHVWSKYGTIFGIILLFGAFLTYSVGKVSLTGLLLGVSVIVVFRLYYYIEPKPKIFV